MNIPIRIVLTPSPAQLQRLVALQRTFTEACNALAPLVQQHRCWNRVALHHLAYKGLRSRFPQLGSQMACNAIYSVSRAARLVFQHPKSSFHLARLGERALPRLQFQGAAPVYFDRHTLSIKDGQVSLFTLDGRMRFQLGLSPADEQRFRSEKLREIVLAQVNGRFVLTFHFAGDAPAPGEDAAPAADGDLPEYVLVIDTPPPAAAPRPVQPPVELPT